MRWNEIIGGYPCFRKAVPVSAAGRIRVTHPCAGRHQRHCCLHAAPRLACVRPVASVHPEPGSNSSLYKFFCLFPQPDFRFSLFKFHLFNLHWRFVSKSTRKDSLIVSPLLYYFCLFFPVFQWTLSVCPRRFSESGCKGTHFFFLSKLFYNFFAIIFWIFFHCVPKRLILNIMLNNMFFQDFRR